MDARRGISIHGQEAQLQLSRMYTFRQSRFPSEQNNIWNGGQTDSDGFGMKIVPNSFQIPNHFHRIPIFPQFLERFQNIRKKKTPLRQE